MTLPHMDVCGKPCPRWVFFDIVFCVYATISHSNECTICIWWKSRADGIDLVHGEVTFVGVNPMSPDERFAFDLNVVECVDTLLCDY